MSSDSECGDQFFDAEDNTPVKTTRSKSKAASQVSPLAAKHEPASPTKSLTFQGSSSSSWEPDSPVKTVLPPASSDHDRREIEKKALENEKRQRRLEELRKRVQSDDYDSGEIHSQASSQTSSIDSVYLHQLTTHVASGEGGGGEDANSVVSLGKVGRILSGSETISLRENPSACPSERTSTASTPGEDEPTTAKLQEPDVVASTKVERNTVELMPPPPVAPPRRKRRLKHHPAAPKQLPLEDIREIPTIPSPATTVSSLAREFEHSLDLRSAVKGDYVVKPQDEEQAKAEGAPLDATDSVPSSRSGTFECEYIDPTTSKQLNMVVRTRTDSGKQMTDLEILEQVMVLNLDTGEKIPLNLAEDRLPRCLNPLSLHIMRLTSEYVSNSSLEKDKMSDEDNDDKKSCRSEAHDGDGATVTTKKKRIKNAFNKTVNKIKSVAGEVYHARHNEEMVESSEDEPMTDAKQSIKFKSASSHKGPYEFDNLKLIQDLSGQHSGAVWTMKFSCCGRLLATAGQDHILRVWVLKDSYDYFNNMRQKYNAEAKISPSPSQENLYSSADEQPVGAEERDSDDGIVFMTRPFFSYTGHTADLLDVSWSKNYFILSSSMDKTVRLWHISRKECLCCFQHIDFVTAIAFHPRDDRYFISGSLDGKLRLWNIPDKKVALWNELDGQTKLITSANFCQNGKFAVVGSYDGRCVFYNTEQLKYYTQIHVRSTRGRNAKGRKISGIEPMPGEDKILVTSNDSRIRLYDLRDLSLTCKYKGYVNLSSQIRASFSHDGKFIISGSENQYVYMWKTHHDYSKFSSARRDRNEYWEGVKAHNAVVTAAVFAPNSSLIISQLEKEKTTGRYSEEAEAGAAAAPTLPPPSSSSSSSASAGGGTGYVLVTADFNGGIKVFANRMKTKAFNT